MDKLIQYVERCRDIAWAKLEKQHGSIIGAKPPVYINKRLKTTAGRCWYDGTNSIPHPHIDVAHRYLVELPKLIGEDTIPHELIHMVAFRKHGATGHCAYWKALMVQYGLPPTRLHNFESELVNKRMAALK